MTLTITLDKRSEESLQKISTEQGVELTNMASRLLQRAIRAAQPKPVYDIEALKAAYAEFADEDIALSEATVAEHAALLAHEDQA
ncbi:MAG: hypothetical protein M3Y13_07460 [Armatimonadota bacterium]|nr:hypothetical protein [Armatimonadota bacterium]